MYFRIYEPSDKGHLVIESDCTECAGDCAAALVLGPPPWPDGYMDGIDYGLIEARTRGDLAAGDEVVMAICTCSERERALRDEDAGDADGEEEGDLVTEAVS